MDHSLEYQMVQSLELADKSAQGSVFEEPLVDINMEKDSNPIHYASLEDTNNETACEWHYFGL